MSTNLCSPETHNKSFEEAMRDLDTVQSELLSIQTERLHLALANTRAELSQTKRKLSVALESCADKDKLINELEQQNSGLNERVVTAEKTAKEQSITLNSQHHRINELETHLTHRDHLIAQLHNRRMMRFVNKYDRLKQRILRKP